MHLNSSTVYAYSSRQTKSTKSHAKLYFALEQSKKVLFAMNVSCPTGVNVTQSGLVSLMTSGLMFGVFWKKDYLKARGGPSLGQVGQFRNRRQSTGRGSLHRNTKKGLANNRFPRISLRVPQWTWVGVQVNLSSLVQCFGRRAGRKCPINLRGMQCRKNR